jgi:hypothetical protein
VSAIKSDPNYDLHEISVAVWKAVDEALDERLRQEEPPDLLERLALRWRARGEYLGLRPLT